MNKLDYGRLKRNLLITEEIFYNKELCDAIRNIVINSACNFEDVNICLSMCDDYNSAVPVIKTLFDNGFDIYTVLEVLNKQGYGSKRLESAYNCLELLKVREQEK